MTELQVHIAYNKQVWVVLDPRDMDPEDWAVADATLSWQEVGVEIPEPEQITRLATVMFAGYTQVTDLAERTDLDMTGFLHLPGPEQVGPIAVLTFANADGAVLDRDSLAQLAGANAPRLAERAKVTDISTSLGVGVRVRSITTSNERKGIRKVATVTGSLCSIWWVPEADTVVKLQTSTEDLEDLVRTERDFDELAESIQRQ